jgi:hypothetical protein
MGQRLNLPNHEMCTWWDAAAEFARTWGRTVGFPLMCPNDALGTTGFCETHKRSGPKFPHVQADMVGEDGNAFAIIGRVRQALKRGGVADADIQTFTDEATSGDYDHLLQTVFKTVETD